MLSKKEKKAIFAKDERITHIVEYPEGFVANAYKWRAPGTRYVTWRDGTETKETYDKKRSRGQGPLWTALSENNGVLLKG